MADLAARVLAVLPQTQCRRCGFCDCQAYAYAIVDGSVGINQCPPGGAQGIERLAALTAKAVVALNPENGNIYAFHENLDHFIELAVHSAEKMNVDPSMFGIKSNPSSNEPFSIEDSIPVFLQKMA